MGKRIFYAFGLAIWLLASNLVDAFYSSGVPVYHSQLATPPVFFAFLLDLLFIIVFAVVFYPRLRARAPRLTSPQVMVAVVPVLIVAMNRMLIAALWEKGLHMFGIERWTRSATIDLVMPVPYPMVFLLWTAWCLLILGIPWMRRRGAALCMGALKIFLLSGGLLGLSLMLNFVRGGIRRTADAKLASFHAKSPEEQQTRPRIVWIVMDELSYDQAFEHRAADLQMPAFDRMRATSTVYADTRPVSFWTDLAVPSLITGQQILELHYSYWDKLAFRHSDAKWYRFDPQQTIFADAERAGWNVALAGWWNPYCTIFSGITQRCSWAFNQAYAPMTADNSLSRNVEQSVAYQLRPWRVPPFLWVRLNENRGIINRALEDINDDRMDLVFIHVGVPHFPYPFDRHTGKEELVSGHSYLDGLAYADSVLGRLLNEMQKTPRWKNTTVIVNGDHSWRTDIWMDKPGWTREDYKASNQGKFDDRPLMMVHAAGQTDGVTVTAPTPLLHVHDVMESVLRTGKVGP